MGVAPAATLRQETEGSEVEISLKPYGAIAQVKLRLLHAPMASVAAASNYSKSATLP
jgi:hypothetical protein